MRQEIEVKQEFEKWLFEVRKRWLDAGIKLDDNDVHSCWMGWEAARSFYLSKAEDTTKAELIEALKRITVYDLYECSAVEDNDFEQDAKHMYEIAQEALEKAKGDR